jgi:predicted DNA-binding transcriptional regulator AlpA
MNTAASRKPMPNDPRDPDSIDFEGILYLDDLCRLLGTGGDTIRRRLKENTFPIPPLPGGIDNRLRWSGPLVRRWIRENGRLDGAEGTK